MGQGWGQDMRQEREQWQWGSVGQHGARIWHAGMDSLLCLQRVFLGNVVAGDEAFTSCHQ